MYDELRRFEEEMNRMFEEIWRRPLRRGQLMLPEQLMLPGERVLEKLGGHRRPYTDLIESEKDLTATIEMPGLNKEDIKINITQDMLEVSAETKHEEEIKEKDYIYKERRGESYHRSMSLPSQIDPDGAKASYNNGILEIKMPKTEIRSEEHTSELQSRLHIVCR